jgi:hypothetical protein
MNGSSADQRNLSFVIYFVYQLCPRNECLYLSAKSDQDSKDLIENLSLNGDHKTKGPLSFWMLLKRVFSDFPHHHQPIWYLSAQPHTCWSDKKS